MSPDGINSGKYSGEISTITVNVIYHRISARIIVDTNLVEIYLNEEEHSVFALAYPEPGNTDMEFYVKNGRVKIDSMEIYSLNSIWKKEKFIILLRQDSYIGTGPH